MTYNCTSIIYILVVVESLSVHILYVVPATFGTHFYHDPISFLPQVFLHPPQFLQGPLPKM